MGWFQFEELLLNMLQWHSLHSSAQFDRRNVAKRVYTASTLLEALTLPERHCFQLRELHQQFLQQFQTLEKPVVKTSKRDSL